MTLSEDGSSYTFDADSKRLLERVASDLERHGELFSAHKADQWGEAEWGSFVERDLSYAKNTDCTICLLLNDDQGLFIESPGAYCELGAALAAGKAVIFVKKRGENLNPSSFFVKELITLHPVYELNDDYSLPSEAIDYLQNQVKIIRTAVDETFKEQHLLGDHSVVTTDGLKLMIREGKLSPKLSAGSSFVIDYISQMSLSNENVIDIGWLWSHCFIAKKRFPNLEMTALDISTPAIESQRECCYNDLEIDIIQSDHFQLESTKRYDLALLAAPYHDAPQPTDADPLGSHAL